MAARPDRPPDPPGFLNGSEYLRRAFSLATEAHAGQWRKGGEAPYVGHAVDVARRLHEHGADERLLAAALLHDVIEDSELTVGRLVEEFGVEVGELVAALTDDESIADYVERKRALRRQVAEAGGRATAIYIADKLVNLCDLRRMYVAEGELAAEGFKAPLEVRIELWREDLAMGRRIAPRLALLDELEAELDAIEVQRELAAGLTRSG